MIRTSLTRDRTLRWLMVATLAVAGASAAGCATSVGPQHSPVPIEQQIADAKTRVDHERLADEYEAAAGQARQQADTHRAAMRRYQESPYTAYFSAHHGQTAAFAQRCQSAIRASEQIAEDDLALAQLHRDLAAELQK